MYNKLQMVHMDATRWPTKGSAVVNADAVIVNAAQFGVGDGMSSQMAR